MQNTPYDNIPIQFKVTSHGSMNAFFSNENLSHFSYLCSKHRFWVFVSLHEAVLTSTQNLCSKQKQKKKKKTRKIMFTPVTTPTRGPQPHPLGARCMDLLPPCRKSTRRIKAKTPVEWFSTDNGHLTTVLLRWWDEK